MIYYQKKYQRILAKIYTHPHPSTKFNLPQRTKHTALINKISKNTARAHGSDCSHNRAIKAWLHRQPAPDVQLPISEK